MKKWLVVLSLLAFSTSAFAQKIKVKRVKGNQAVVEFSGGQLENGQVYEISSDEFANPSDSGSSTARDHVVGLRFSFFNTKSDVSGSQNETDIRLDAKYGWNLGTFEFGPLFTYTSDQTANITSTSMTFGAFADYNVIPNAPGEIFVYGLGGQGGMGQSDSGTGSKRDLMIVLMGPFVKWFPTGHDFGIRFDAVYSYAKATGNNADATITGMAFGAELMAYF